VLEALTVATQLLSELDQANRIPALYEKAWSLTRKPQDMAGEFAVQSNWFRVGLRYAEILASVGRGDEAAKVREAIGVR
jgi:hypothetical protein